MARDLKVFSGRANVDLAREICEYLGLELGQIEITDFSDGEIYVQVRENVRGCDVFIIQPTCTPGNDNIMELLIIIDALKRASADRVTAVMPYYGYARQDRKLEPRVPITAKLVADLISAAGAYRVLAMDFHAGQIQGFFNIPVDHLFATSVLIEYIRSIRLKELMVISPDAGGVERARAYAKRLNCSLGFIDKRREDKNVSRMMHIVGDVKGKSALIVDDIVDTAGTLAGAAKAVIEAGAKEVYASCTHAVLSGPALERIAESPLKELIVTNTIPAKKDAASLGKIRVLSVAKLLGEAIKRIHDEASVSSLFV